MVTDLKITKNEPYDSWYNVYRMSPIGWEGIGYVEKTGVKRWMANHKTMSQDGFLTRKAAAQWLSEKAGSGSLD